MTKKSSEFEEGSLKKELANSEAYRDLISEHVDKEKWLQEGEDNGWLSNGKVVN